MPLLTADKPRKETDVTGVQPCHKREAAPTFRITIHDSAAEFRLAVEGPLTASGAAELEQCWRTASSTVAGRRFVIDLARVISIDETSPSTIGRLLREGAILTAARMEVARALADITGGTPHGAEANPPRPLFDLLACFFRRFRMRFPRVARGA